MFWSGAMACSGCLKRTRLFEEQIFGSVGDQPFVLIATEDLE
jgi:hypothetical protein